MCVCVRTILCKKGYKENFILRNSSYICIIMPSTRKTSLDRLKLHCFWLIQNMTTYSKRLAWVIIIALRHIIYSFPKPYLVVRYFYSKSPYMFVFETRVKTFSAWVVHEHQNCMWHMIANEIRRAHFSLVNVLFKKQSPLWIFQSEVLIKISSISLYSVYIVH